MGERMLNLLFPPICIFCGTLIGGAGERLCPKCSRDLPLAAGLSGVRYGKYFDRCYSMLLYQEPFRRAFLRYKFEQSLHYGDIFGQWLAKFAAELHLGQVDLVTWVPLHWSRWLRRGFNQDVPLAQAVAETLDKPCVRLLSKPRRVRAQSGTTGGRTARQRNVSGAFRAVRSLEGQHILLVDDLITTGATLEECATVLRAAGAGQITCLTLGCSAER